MTLESFQSGEKLQPQSYDTHADVQQNMQREVYGNRSDVFAFASGLKPDTASAYLPGLDLNFVQSGDNANATGCSDHVLAPTSFEQLKATGDRQAVRDYFNQQAEECLRFAQSVQNTGDQIKLARVDATLDRNVGTLSITELDGNAKHKKGETLTIPNVVSGNGECSAPGPGSDGRYDNVTNRGPIPKGNYLIGNGYENEHLQHLHPGGDAHWYRLYGADGKGGFSYDELANGRGVLNLHTGRESDGCVTVWSDKKQTDTDYPHSANYDKVKDFLDNTKPFEYKPGDTYRGVLHVK